MRIDRIKRILGSRAIFLYLSHLRQLTPESCTFTICYCLNSKAPEAHITMVLNLLTHSPLCFTPLLSYTLLCVCVCCRYCSFHFGMLFLDFLSFCFAFVLSRRQAASHFRPLCSFLHLSSVRLFHSLINLCSISRHSSPPPSFSHCWHIECVPSSHKHTRTHTHTMLSGALILTRFRIWPKLIKNMHTNEKWTADRIEKIASWDLCYFVARFPTFVSFFFSPSASCRSNLIGMYEYVGLYSFIFSVSLSNTLPFLPALANQPFVWCWHLFHTE